MRSLTHTIDRSFHWRWLLLLSIAFGSIITVPIQTVKVQAQQNPQALSIQADTQEANSKTEVVTARGNVRLNYPSRKIQAQANLAQYFIKQKRILLTGNVLIAQQGSTLEGESVLYLIDEGTFIANPKVKQQVRSNYIVPEQGGKGLTILANTQEANSKTEVVTAKGNVRLSYPDKKLQARANTAQYNIKGKQIVLSGNVLVINNGNSLQADTITYLIEEGRFIAKQKPGIPVQSIYMIPDKTSNQWLVRVYPIVNITPVKIILENIHKSYGKRNIVNRVSLSVSQGEIVGLLGPNGAGKTTTFYIATGLVKPNHGKVWLDDEDITSLSIHQRARLGIGYLAQEPSIFRSLTVLDNILLVMEQTNVPRKLWNQKLTALITEFNLEKVVDTLGNQVSGGERRRTEIARSLAAGINGPKFLFLDEPFAGVDPIAVAEIQKIIAKLRDRNMGILITDHNVRETLAVTDRAYIMREGQVFASGSSEEMYANPLVRQYYLGSNFQV